MAPESPDDWIERLPATVAEHVRSLARHPRFAEHLARFSEVCHLSPGADQVVAATLAEHAWRLAPHDPLVRRHIGWSFRRRVPPWHFSIINDTRRNEAYHAALQRHVRPGMIVLEVGTGTGVLAMLAARAGAAHVYTCESEPLLAEIARENIARNGLSDRVTVIAKKSAAVRLGEDLPRRADLFVSELVDDGLLGEHVLAITRDVAARLLAPDAIVLPARIELRGTLVGGPEWTAGFRAPPVLGLDVSALDRLAAAMVPATHPPPLGDAPDVLVFGFDLAELPSERIEQRTFSVPAITSGTFDGFLHWLRLDFGGGFEFTNRPPARSCWVPQLHVFPRPIPLRSGEELPLHAWHNGETIRIWPAAPPLAP